jgi:hypothetical protein
MNQATKILAMLVCLSLCVGGAMLARTENTKHREQKTQFAPANNRQPNRAIWILV